MPTRLQSTNFTSLEDNEYTINIIDTAFVGSATDISISSLTFESKGNDRKFEEHIYTGVVQLGFYILTPDDALFLTDIRQLPEGTLYLEVKRGLTTVFMGRILTEGVEVKEDFRTELKLTAIDGLTTLKGIDYNYTFDGTIAELLAYCIRQIDVIDQFYLDTDKILACNSALSCNVVGFSNIFEDVEHQDYFFRIENEQRKPFTCFEVVEELLKRYFLELKYYNGKYYVIGKETYNYGFGSWVGVSKDGTIITHLETATAYDIGDDTDDFYMIFGSTYHTKRGIKKAIISTEQDFTNYKLGTGKIYDPGDPYELIGTVIANDQYVGYTTILLDTIDPDVHTIRVSLYYRYTLLSDSSLTYLYDNSGVLEYNFSPKPITVTSNVSEDATEVDILPTFKKFIHEVTIPIIAGNADLDFKYEVEFFDSEGDPISTDIVVTATNEFDLNPPKIYQDKVKFEQENDTGNTETLEIQIFGSDQYGSTLANPRVKDANSGDNWRFDSSKTYRPLERSMLEEYLFYLTKPIQFYTGTVYSRNHILNPIHKVTYKTRVYKIGGYRYDLSKDDYRVNILYLNYNTETVTDNTELTVTLEPFTEEENISGLIDNNSAAPPVTETFLNVTTASVTWSNDIIDSLVTSQIQSFHVWVSGIRYNQVTSSPGFRQYTIDTTTNTFNFAAALRGEDVVITFFNQLVAASTS